MIEAFPLRLRFGKVHGVSDFFHDYGGMVICHSNILMRFNCLPLYHGDVYEQR